MGKTVMARRATKTAIEFADSVSHEEYKSIKHMNKIELVDYMRRVWQRGYDIGHEAGVRDAQAAVNAKGVSEHTNEEGAADGDV